MESNPSLRSGSETQRNASRVSKLQRAVVVELALELYGILSQVLREFGISNVNQKRLSKRPRRKSPGAPISIDVLRRYTQLGDLIAAWHSDTAFLDFGGNPRVLAIEGSGITFATLARRFLPGMSVPDAVNFACRAAEVGTLQGGKVALFGSTLVNISKHPESALAQYIYHIACLSRTSLDNYRVGRVEGSEGRIERIIRRIISIDDFELFQKQIRPQIQDLCEKVDGMLQPLEKRAARLRSNKFAVGMGIYLYTDESPHNSPRSISRHAKKHQAKRPSN
jgi:hypothetical protein